MHETDSGIHDSPKQNLSSSNLIEPFGRSNSGKWESEKRKIHGKRKNENKNKDATQQWIDVNIKRQQNKRKEKHPTYSLCVTPVDVRLFVWCSAHIPIYFDICSALWPSHVCVEQFELWWIVVELANRLNMQLTSPIGLLISIAFEYSRENAQNFSHWLPISVAHSLSLGMRAQMLFVLHTKRM